VRELSLHILDIVENSLEAGATRVEVRILEQEQGNRLIIEVVDDGCGMDEATVARVSDPFYTTRKSRHVGLGIPLLKAAAERCDGQLSIRSAPGQGTTVRAEFARDHIDRAPLGDMTSTLMAMLLSDRACRLVYEHRVDERVFGFSTDELVRALGDVPLANPRVRDWLAACIARGEAELIAGGTEAR
jgi:hypothetical protein